MFKRNIWGFFSSSRLKKGWVLLWIFPVGYVFISVCRISLVYQDKHFASPLPPPPPSINQTYTKNAHWNDLEIDVGGGGRESERERERIFNLIQPGIYLFNFITPKRKITILLTHTPISPICYMYLHGFMIIPEENSDS